MLTYRPALVVHKCLQDNYLMRLVRLRSRYGRDLALLWSVNVIRCLSTAGLLRLALAGSPVFAAPPAGHTNVDRGVRDSLRSGAATQQVINVAAPGHRAQMR